MRHPIRDGSEERRQFPELHAIQQERRVLWAHIKEKQKELAILLEREATLMDIHYGSLPDDN